MPIHGGKGPGNADPTQVQSTVRREWPLSGTQFGAAGVGNGPTAPIRGAIFNNRRHPASHDPKLTLVTVGLGGFQL
jgi:hypothetical protein